MFKRTKTPATVVEWRSELGRLQAELVQARERIKAESGRREQLAVAAAGGDANAEREFSGSFAIETNLGHEVERLGALATHAERQLTFAEQVEREAADLLRRKKLAAVYDRQREIAARLDAAFLALAVEVRAFDETCKAIKNLTGTTPRRIPRAITLAAKAAGLREFLEISIPGQGIPLLDQVQGPASTEEAA